MGHHKLRTDNECQNCGHTVEVAYCSKCGQQNTETRQSFHHLLTHFAEDLTHYDGAFWKTIKYLLFRPGRLTIEYLLGHRMRFVPPVKLYIFISFVTFFLLAVMAPDNNEHESIEKFNAEHATIGTDDVNVKAEYLKKEKKIKDYNGVVYTSVKQFDSLHKSAPDNLKKSAMEFHLEKAAMLFEEKNPSARDIVILVAHTIPKVLFIYMPIFAFWLWLVHIKKRWYFFDHGIFTLHYFSLLLLLITILLLLDWILSYNPYDFITNIILAIATSITFLYPIFYFFRSHSRFYGERKAISRLKGIFLFILNSICYMIMILVTFVYMAYNLH